jgi:hypothetical protein
MKKLLVIILITGVVASSLFATTFFEDEELFYPNVTFSPISARTEAMGGAGVATAAGADAFFMNPANLGSRRFSLNLPSVSVTLFNPQKILDTGIIQDMADGNEPDPAVAGLEFLSTLNRGKGDVLTTDIATSFTGGGFGVGLQIQEQLHNYDKGTDANLFAEVNAGVSVGFGFRLDFVPEVLSVDVGASVRPTYKAYTEGIGAPGLITMFTDESSDPGQTLMRDTALAAGYAVPFDIGVNVNLPVGLRVSAVAKNLNGKYTMQKYSEAGAWVNEMMDMVGQEAVYTDEAPEATTSEFTVTVPWSLDFGFGWMPELGGFGKILRPTLAFDFVDVVGMFEAMETDEDAYWNYLKAGAEVKLLSMIDVRAGLNRGALSVGLGLDLLVFHIDASYYWREKGVEIGDKTVDALTVRFNLGVDGR